MQPHRPILNQHRVQRFVLWALTLLHWIAANLSGLRLHPRHRAQRGDITLGWLSRIVGTIIVARALLLLRHKQRCPTRYWLRGRDLRRRHFRRSLLGAKLRRALRHRDFATHIAQLIDALRNLDTHAAHLAHRIRFRLRRLFTEQPPIAGEAAILGPPAPSPAASDSS